MIVSASIEGPYSSAKASTRAYNLGLIYFNNKDYANSIEAFKGVATNDPNYSEAQSKNQEAKYLLPFTKEYNLGLLYFNSKDYENSIEAFKSVATNDLHYAEVQSKTQVAKNLEAEQLLANAKDHIANNEFDEALIRLNKALTLNPNLTEVSTLIQT